MPISARQGGYQVSIYHQGKRARKTLPTVEEAKAWETMIKSRLEDGMGLLEAQEEVVRGETLGELFTLTAENVWGPKKAARTLIGNGRRITETIGPGTKVKNIKRAQIDKAVARWRKEGNTSGTINRKLAALSKMLSYAVDLEIIPSRPKMPTLKEAEGRLMHWSPEIEAKALAWFEYTGEDQVRDYVLVSLDTGMRQAEVLSRRPEHVTYQEGEPVAIEVDGDSTKSSQTRIIPLTNRLKPLVARLVDAAGDGKLFPRLTPERIRKPWARMAAHVNAPNVGTPHTMRHTFGCRLVQKGAPLQRVKDLMGHKTMTVTLRYARLAPENLAETIELLN